MQNQKSLTTFSSNERIHLNSSNSQAGRPKRTLHQVDLSYQKGWCKKLPQDSIVRVKQAPKLKPSETRKISEQLFNKGTEMKKQVADWRQAQQK